MFIEFTKCILAFLIWTLIAYCIHRAAHIRSKANLLWYIHKAHHQKDYKNQRPSWPQWYEYFFCFGTTRRTLDIWIVFVIPLIVVTTVVGGKSWTLLPLYYLYEVFLADTVVEHNPKITGAITRFLSIGQYHLKHHAKPRVNYSFFIPLWDYVFGTCDIPQENSPRRNVTLTASMGTSL